MVKRIMGTQSGEKGSMNIGPFSVFIGNYVPIKQKRSAGIAHCDRKGIDFSGRSKALAAFAGTVGSGGNRAAVLCAAGSGAGTGGTGAAACLLEEKEIKKVSCRQLAGGVSGFIFH